MKTEVGESQPSSFDYWHFIVQSIFLKRTWPNESIFPFSILHFMSQVSFVEKGKRAGPESRNQSAEKTFYHSVQILGEGFNIL